MNKPITKQTAAPMKDPKIGFDDLLKRMLSTPPKPRVKPEKQKPGK